MFIAWIISLLYLVFDYLFKIKSRLGLLALVYAFFGLTFVVSSIIYIVKFIHYFWYPYFFTLFILLIITKTFQLLNFLFFPFLFWRKKELGSEKYIEWARIFNGKRLPLMKLIYFSNTQKCSNFPHSRFDKVFNYLDQRRSLVENEQSKTIKIKSDPPWVFDEPIPSVRRVFVYIDGFIYVICTSCKSQIDKLECKPGTMEPLDKYDMYYDEDLIYSSES